MNRLDNSKRMAYKNRLTELSQDPVRIDENQFFVKNTRPIGEINIQNKELEELMKKRIYSKSNYRRLNG